uniref:Uncharacterized protein n=1 Tax=Glossina pallidipes TaxID=7398 RepID=A0A1B0A3D0_GLOPL
MNFVIKSLETFEVLRRSLYNLINSLSMPVLSSSLSKSLEPAKEPPKQSPNQPSTQLRQKGKDRETVRATVIKSIIQTIKRDNNVTTKLSLRDFEQLGSDEQHPMDVF